jgi:exodeoxyribonuclease VII small subunit
MARGAPGQAIPRSAQAARETGRPLRADHSDPIVVQMATRKKPLDPSSMDPLSAEGASGDALSFEESMAKLGQIVEELESGELTLETSLKKFEEGIKLARNSQARLDAAETKVEELLGFDAEATPLTEEI